MMNSTLYRMLGRQVILNQAPKRQIWHWLDHVWNKYDPERVKEVGPNRACTEWLLRCGAHVKYKNWGTFVDDYNKIPPGGNETFQIEEINADNSCIMGKGFEYLNGLKGVKKIKFRNCEVLDDLALAKLSYVRESLEELVVVFCPSITDLGLTYIYLLKNLKRVHLNTLPNVKNPQMAVKLIKENLPNCAVDYIEE